MQATQEDVQLKVQKIIGKIDKLPTPPFVFQQINKVINNPHTSAFDIAAIISEDAALTAKVLKLTNSVFYGRTQEIKDVKQAVIVVGLDALKNIVLSSSLIDSVGKNSPNREYTESFWRHSLAVAFLSKILARNYDKSNLKLQEEAFSAGILHDIGKLVISSHLMEMHAEKIQLVKLKAKCEYEIENEVFECNHTDIGQYFGESWKLPSELVEAINCHHEPQEKGEKNPLINLIHISNFLIHSSENPTIHGIAQKTWTFYPDCWEQLSLSPKLIHKLLEEFETEYAKAETFLQI
ncbi:MAG: HDOD domain-containing protein [candidate division Zixibacteria bacterium]|nr:HDOD domain-containing protein [candidate division Zixibacteria bacterium]